jgi:hypothetical protein
LNPPGNPVEVQRGVPWHAYIERFSQILGEEVIVSQLKPENKYTGGGEKHMAQLYAIRKFEASDIHETVNILRRLQHENFIDLCRVFLDGSTCYTVSALDEISLYDFCKPKFNLTETQMAAIISQVIFSIGIAGLVTYTVSLIASLNDRVSRLGKFVFGQSEMFKCPCVTTGHG